MSEEEKPKHMRYHTDACGRATTKRCRCACGGARHGELVKKDVGEALEELKARPRYERLHPKRTDSIPPLKPVRLNVAKKLGYPPLKHIPDREYFEKV